MSTVAPPATDAEATARSCWRPALVAYGLVVVAFAAALADPIVRLWALWLDSYDYGHGPVVVLASLYLLWLRRDAFRAAAPRPDLRGLAAAAILMAAWFAARALGIVVVEQLVLVPLLLAITLTVLGARVMAIAALPVLYLLFAVPVWSELGPALQEWTAEASTVMARRLGVPIYLEGLYMTIPDGRFVVAETCSGLRYLLAALSLGGFYGLLNLYTTWARVVMLAFCAALAIGFNYVRVVSIVLIGHHTQMQSPLVKDHIGFGWVLFIAVVIATLVAGRILERLEGEPRTHREIFTGIPADRLRFGAAAVLSAMLVLAPSLAAERMLQGPSQAPRLALPAAVESGGWTQVPAAEPVDWRPRFQGADAEQLVRYRGEDGGWVEVYVAWYDVQRQDAEVVNDRNILFDHEQWAKHYQHAAESRRIAAGGLPVAEARIHRGRGRERRLLWRSYWVGGEFTVAPLEAKWLQLRGLLSGRPQAAALVLSAADEGDGERARERLAAFAEAAMPALRETLEAASRTR